MAARGARLPLHYGWVVVGTGTLSVLACLGFGRFALGMLLPAMGASLELSYSQMGFISTGNFVGYLVAVMAAGRLAARFGYRAVVTAGLGMVAVSLLAVSTAGAFWQVLALYVITGLGSGASNVPLMALVSHWFRRSHRGRAAGCIVSGSGFAIIISGWLIPAINASAGAEGWRISWAVLGVLTLGITLLAATLLRNRPADVGREPVGAVGVAASEVPAVPPRSRLGSIVTTLGVVYFFFGFTYVIYATFIVTTLVQEYGVSEAVAGRFWMWVGAFSLLSGPVFGGLSDRIGRRAGLQVVFAFQATAYLLVALHLPIGFIYASIALYGMVVWSIPSIMAAAVGDYLGPDRAAMAFGTVTVFFGIGQILGPAVAGMLADAGGGFGGSYLMAAVAVILGIGLSLFLPGKRARAAGSR